MLNSNLFLKCLVSNNSTLKFIDKGNNDSKYEEVASLNNSRITGGPHNVSGMQRSPFVAQNSQTSTLRDTSNLKGKIVSLEVRFYSVNLTDIFEHLTHFLGRDKIVS